MVQATKTAETCHGKREKKALRAGFLGNVLGSFLVRIKAMLRGRNCLTVKNQFRKTNSRGQVSADDAEGGRGLIPVLHAGPIPGIIAARIRQKEVYGSRPIVRTVWLCKGGDGYPNHQQKLLITSGYFPRDAVNSPLLLPDESVPFMVSPSTVPM
jgi:hypothetical protein